MTLLILQYNCNCSYQALCDVHQCMHEVGSRVALVQELADMRVFFDSNDPSAVIVNDANLQATLALASSNGVCDH